MKQHLFSEFKGSTDQEVRDQIQKDLKSFDFESTLCWESLEGITIKPVYDRNSKAQKKIINAFPEQWYSSHTIQVEQDIEAVIRSCKAAVQSDVEVLLLRLTDSDLSIDTFSKALECIQTTLYIQVAVIFLLSALIYFTLALKIERTLFFFLTRSQT